MVKKFIIRFLIQNGSKIFRSVLNAYKDVTKQAPKDTGNTNKDSNMSDKFGFKNFLVTPMTKEEAMKILNVKEGDMTPELVMEMFEKYFESNDPEKGGSFYLQNKIYYAKEFLMQDFPAELNKSKYNPDDDGNEGEEVPKENKNI